jgi:glutathione S-transferase
MILLGSITSPYVRRVRIVANALRAPLRLLDSRTAAGQAELQRCSPTLKVPCAVFDDGVVVWDSQAINAELLRRLGPGSLRPAGDPVVESNLLYAIDAALDAAINVFYLCAAEPSTSDNPYVQKQRQRVGVAMGWVAAQVEGGRLADREGLGLAEVALLSALGWMRFRQTYPVDDNKELAAFLDMWERDGRVAGTGPVA